MRLTSVRQKLFSTLLLLLFPSALLLLLSLLLKKEPLDNAGRQLAILDIQKGVKDLLQKVEEGRQKASRSPNEAPVDVRRSQAEIDEAHTRLESMRQTTGSGLGRAQSWQALSDARNLLNSAVSGNRDGRELIKALNSVSEAAFVLEQDVTGAATASLETGVPNLATLRTLSDILSVNDAIGRSRDEFVLGGRTTTPRTALELPGRLANLRDSFNRLLKSVDTADFSTQLIAYTRENNRGSADAYALGMLGDPTLAAPEASLEAVSAGFAAYDTLRNALRESIDRFQNQQRTQLILLTITVLFGLGLMIAPMLFLTRPVIRQIDEIVNTLDEVGRGAFDTRARIVSDDELARVADSLNSMLNNFNNLIQSQSERDDIQQAIQKLMAEVADVASGDLTVEAEVTNDFTGSLADAINFMISQLRAIVSNVQEATMQVSTSANEIMVTTEHLSRGGDSQASQIRETSEAINEIADSIQQVADNASQSLAVAEQARNNAKRGTLAVNDTINGMERIRDQVQETAKRIKRLGESSQEIGDIVKLIGDIADRTSILALNASIQAAMAGEAGRGFAVVAEEVERLAERSNEATRKIATLIKTIQTTTAEAVSAMEESTREVVEGSNLALTAGTALNEIDQVSNRLAEIITMIAHEVKQQARGSEALSKSMSQISEVTQQTALGTREAARSVSQLARLADELRGSVSTFKLPRGEGSHGMSSPTGPVSGTYTVAPRGRGGQDNGADNVPQSQFNQRVTLVR